MRTGGLTINKRLEDALTTACGVPPQQWCSETLTVLALIDELEVSGQTIIFRPTDQTPFLAFLDTYCAQNDGNKAPDAATPPAEHRLWARPWSTNEGRTPSLCWRFTRLTRPPLTRVASADVTPERVAQFFSEILVMTQARMASEAEAPPVKQPSQKREEEYSFRCVACQEAIATVLMNPCHHVPLCAACWPSLCQSARASDKPVQCPMCRTRVTGTSTVCWM